ncbi:hypothetical protein NE237_026344 [Protea cynaroides]|uniref:Uncharacterized protein n=1 Tax=Protea cynaroides TaxID=273540 RepID=A0A9Q0H429_9MAGN|nr:hypothetical protein NE237_026344 [Protea cynaroides]
MVDEDCISWIDIVHTAYCTVLKDIPDGRSVSFSVRAEMPNGGYYEVKSDADVLALVKIFKEQSRAMLLEVYGVNVGDATLDREAEEQDKKILLKKKLLVKEEAPLHRSGLGALFNESRAGWVIRDLFSMHRDQAWVITEMGCCRRSKEDAWMIR